MERGREKKPAPDETANDVPGAGDTREVAPPHDSRPRVKATPHAQANGASRTSDASKTTASTEEAELEATKAELVTPVQPTDLLVEIAQPDTDVVASEEAAATIPSQLPTPEPVVPSPTIAPAEFAGIKPNPPPPAPVDGAVEQPRIAQEGAETVADNASPAQIEAPADPVVSRNVSTGFETAMAAVDVGLASQSGGITETSGLTTTLQPTALSLGDAKSLAAGAAVQDTRAGAPASSPVPLGAVPMTIGLRALGSNSQFEIRLDPVELGRIDVTLDIDRERGAVSTKLVVDRPETLALLQRDASSLQQALLQAGLDASAGISLSLRGDGSGAQSGDRRTTQGNDGSAARGGESEPNNTAEAVPARVLRGSSGIDIRI